MKPTPLACRLAAGRPRPTAEEFLTANPSVRGRLIYHAMRLRAMSPKGRVSAKAVTEAVRVECVATTTGAAGSWRIDNSLTPGFARWLAAEIPELRDAFEFRASKADAPRRTPAGPVLQFGCPVREESKPVVRKAKPDRRVQPELRLVVAGGVR